MPAVDWLARLIAWIDGIGPCRRFLATVRDGLSFPDEHTAREAVERFATIVAQGVERLDAMEPLPDPQIRQGRTRVRLRLIGERREAIRNTGILSAMRTAFEDLPESARGPNRIVIPTRDGEADFHLLRERCTVVLKDYPPRPKWVHLAWAAALVLTDGGSTPVAWSAVRRGHVEIEELRAEAGEPGYERLLGALGDLTFDYPYAGGIRCLLHAGATLDEVNWWGTSLRGHFPDDADAEALRHVRSVAAWCADHGSALEREDLAAFWESAASPAGRVVAGSLARFLGWLNDPSAQQVAEVGGLVRLLSLPAFRQSLVERLRRWGEPPPRTRLPDECPEGLPAELVALLRRLAFHQRAAGEDARLPKSLRKPLESTARAEREVRHLRGLGEAIAPKQAERLRRLERRGIADARTDAAPEKLIRQAREVAAVTALAAAKVIIRDELAGWWKARFATDPELGRFRWEHLYQLMHWADGLTEASRRLVDAVVAGHREHGPRYRIHLPHNRAWLDVAVEAGLDAEAWFRPPSVRRTLADGSAVTIALAADPRDLFLMGSRFGTCLSLGDGSNRDAVIPNAADANKAVVYAYGADGEPLARKLVGVVGARLVGFDLYCKRAADELAGWVDEFCGAWAARAGLGLADAGVPANLAGGFWYDDGVRAWLPAAHVAHRENRPDESVNPLPDDTGDPLRDALRSDDPAALESLLASDSVHKTAALFRHIVLHPDRPWDRWEAVDRQELFRHLAARGELSGRADPRSWPMTANDRDRFRSESCRIVFDLVPPEAEAIGAAADLLVRLPSAPLESHDTRFGTTGPPPAAGLLPFAKLLEALRRFALWMPEADSGCAEYACPLWAERLAHSWRRAPNLAAALRALSDPIERVREVMRLFCVRVHVPEMVRRLRRQRKDTAPSAEADDIGRILAMGDFGGNARHPHDPARPLADRIADARTDAESARDGCGAEWYFAFAASERAEVPVEVRTRFALGLMANAHSTAMSLWPLLGWLATLPEDDRHALWTSPDADGADGDPPGLRLLRVLDASPDLPAGAILTQALAHADPAIRGAAASAYEAVGRSDRDMLTRMLDRARPWVRPDIVPALAEAVRSDPGS